MTESKTEKKLMIKASVAVFVGRLVDFETTKNGNYLFIVADEDGIVHRVVVPPDMVVDDIYENDVIRCGWEKQKPVQVTVIERA